ncbi:MAG: sulfatase [Planctomycetota bacterium]
MIVAGHCELGVAYCLDSIAPEPERSFVRLRVFTLAGLSLILATGFVWWRKPTPDSIRRPTILLVTLDTLRRDRLGAYGSEAGLTPNLDQFASEAVTYERHYVPAPITLPSHASMLTGLEPFHHGIRRNGSFRLAEEANTVAELLRDHGYQTSAIVSAGVLDPSFGLDQGFDRYHWQSGETTSRSRTDGERATRLAIDELEAGADRASFMWVHYFDVHGPYSGNAPLEETYDAKTRSLDEQLGRLFDHMKEAGLYDSSWILVAADHGQSLGEDDYRGHTLCLYDQTMLAPMMIKPPAGIGADQRVRAITKGADIAPTILSAAAIEPPEGLDGIDLTRTVHDVSNLEVREAYGETRFRVMGFLIRKKMFVQGRWKLVLEPDLPADFDGRAFLEKYRQQTDIAELRAHLDVLRRFERAPRELYDLVKDPSESRNLYGERPDVARRLERALKKYEERQDIGVVSVPFEPDTVLQDQLRALGYR